MKSVKKNEAFEETNDQIFKYLPKGRHTWRQQGFYLVCKSCDLSHAIFIGPNQIMVGEKEDGQPILKKKV